MGGPKVFVVGAGPCGLSVLHNLHKNGDPVEVIVFEKQEDWGGLWNYTWRTGTDDHGLKVHGSMYRVWDCPLIKFRHNVEMAQFCEETQKFTVTVRDLATNEQSTDTYDFLVVAIGHFSTPNTPHFDGIETFPGQINHVHDFRAPELFANRRVLVIGSSYSGEDMAMMAMKFGAKSATVSYRTNKPGYNWPHEKITEKPVIKKFQGNTVTFSDGTSADYDQVIFCTGYLYSFPFLPKVWDCFLVAKNDVYPPLYKGIVFPGCHRLIYMGMQDQYYTFSMFEMQALAARQIILGKFQLPPQEEIEADVQKWVAEKDTAGRDEIRHIEIQTAYCKDLADTFGLHDFKFDVEKEFKQWEHDRAANIATYRDKAFRSINSGTLGAMPNTPWMRAFDDSLQHCFEDCVPSN